MRLGLRSLIVAGITLQDIAINRLRLQRMHLTTQVRLAIVSLALHGIKSVRSSIDISGQPLRLMPIAAVRCSHCLIAECHVNQSLLVGEATEVVHLFALKLVLYAFTIWRIANQGEGRQPEVPVARDQRSLRQSNKS